MMYAVTDGFSGLTAGYESPGTGMNFLIHNMCRLPQSGGQWTVSIIFFFIYYCLFYDLQCNKS